MRKILWGFAIIWFGLVVCCACVEIFNQDYQRCDKVEAIDNFDY